VKISKAGNLVSLEVELLPQSGQALGINPLDLPTLLTEGAQGLGLTVPSNATITPTPGTVIASGSIKATEGGQVALVGQQVGVINGAIDVSGVNGGGTVRIGGDYQGKGSIPNSLTTVVDQASQIKADALTQGNGGKVIVWADGHTQFNGLITAKGGLLGGDGGFAEVSGKQTLRFDGKVNLSAIQGQFGTLLLDPTDVTISNISTGTGNGDSLNGNIPSTATPDNMTLSQGSLEGLAASTNILIEATNNIRSYALSKMK
jgi:hypothetical protein